MSRSSPNADAMLLGLVTHSFAICEEGMRDELVTHSFAVREEGMRHELLKRSWERNVSRALKVSAWVANCKKAHKNREVTLDHIMQIHLSKGEQYGWK